MMINVQDIRRGMVYKFEGDLWTVMFMQHVTPGKGAAFVKVKSRSMKTGNSKEYNFRSGEKIDIVDIFEKPVSYLYKDGDHYVFMDSETFEQFNVPADLCEDVDKYIVENGELTVNIYEDKVLSVNPPNMVNLKVIQADNAVKGDTATKTTKYAELETGYKILVPLFINEGDLVKIDTRTGEYLERVKS